MTELTIGISPCPNDVFIFAGLILHQVESPFEFDFRFEDVESLNHSAQLGKLDVVKISYANYCRCNVTYELLNCGGALGRGVGPLLLTGGDEFVPEAEFLVPGEFTTANFLLDYFLGREVPKRFVPFDEVYGVLSSNPSAQGVVIHENRFTYEEDGLLLVQDLGEHWEDETGYAIPLGAIVVKRDIGAAEEISTAIRSSLSWAEKHRAEALTLCREHAKEMRPDVIEKHIGLYVNEFSYDLGKEGRAAVDHFLALQAEQMKVTIPI